ncbi:MAG: phosphoglycerate kinase, partial [Nanoarchaeota archaeon]
MMFRTLDDLHVKGKRILVRVDFNVPLTKTGSVADDNRIRASLPTIRFLLAKGATVILVTHLGRPKGVDDALRLNAVGKRLSRLLKRDVIKLDDTVGHDVEERVHAARKGSVILLENARFYAEEEKNDAGFAKALSRLADVYVNDAFGTCHRAHASVHGVTRFLPSAAGLLLEKEIDALDAVLTRPKHPFIAIMGGAKVSDKIGVITNLMKRADA